MVVVVMVMVVMMGIVVVVLVAVGIMVLGMAWKEIGADLVVREVIIQAVTPCGGAATKIGMQCSYKKSTSR
jgi:hypothetical protein